MTLGAFYQALPAGQGFHLSSEIAQHLVYQMAQSVRLSGSPEDKP